MASSTLRQDVHTSANVATPMIRIADRIPSLTVVRRRPRVHR
jgi:hypothetical protein